MSDAIDAGGRAIDAVFDDLEVEPQWSIRTPREFTWWPQDYAQRVQADPPVQAGGVEVSRLVAMTTLVREVEPSAEVYGTLGLVNAQGALLSGFVLDPAARTVSLVCTAKVYDDPDAAAARGYSDLMTQVFANAVALQASQAQQTAERLAGLLKGEAAVSRHPASGRRREPSDVVDTVKWLMVQGQSESAWAGAEMRHALRTLERLGARATGSDQGVTAEFPYHGQTALLTMSTTEQHPTIRGGLLVRLTLPGRHDLGDGTRLAATLNGREVAENYFNEFMGGWCHDPRGFLTFVAFHPNVVIGSGLGGLIAHQMALRCQWLAASVFEDPRLPDERRSVEAGVPDPSVSGED
jgi:hypothetical protein